MTLEELIDRIQSSGLFDDSEMKNWSERIQKGGTDKALMDELILDIQRRIDTLFATIGIMNEESDAYKQILLGFYGELKDISREYKIGEKQFEKEAIDFTKEIAARDSEKHIEESRATIAQLTQKKIE